MRRHVFLGAGSLAAVALVFGIIDSDDSIFRASMATAYVALVLLAVTLAFGPVAALRGRRYPVSTDIRRDYGIWSAIVALVHVVVGLQVHLRGKLHEYFVRPLGGAMLPRIDSFGLANYAGLAAIVMLAVLLATSNDVSLRRFGAAKWRRIHTLTYWALALTAAHGAAYQAIEKRSIGFIAVFVVILVALAGIRYARRAKRAVAPGPLR